MDAPIEIDMGLEKLEATIKFADLSVEHILSFGIGPSVPINGALITGARRNPKGGAPIKISAFLGGMVKEIDSGTWKVGDGESGGAIIQMAISIYNLAEEGLPQLNYRYLWPSMC